MGFCTTDLKLGCDCLGHIHYFPAVLNTEKGNPMLIEKAIWCVARVCFDRNITDVCLRLD